MLRYSPKSLRPRQSGRACDATHTLRRWYRCASCCARVLDAVRCTFRCVHRRSSVGGHVHGWHLNGIDLGLGNMPLVGLGVPWHLRQQSWALMGATRSNLERCCAIFAPSSPSSSCAVHDRMLQLRPAQARGEHRRWRNVTCEACLAPGTRPTVSTLPLRLDWNVVSWMPLASFPLELNWNAHRGDI